MCLGNTVFEVLLACENVLLLLFSHRIMFNSLWLQHAMLPCPSLFSEVCSNACPLCRWCHPTISSSVILFSSCPQSFPASGSFQLSQIFTSGGQSIGVSVLPMNTQDWSPLGWTGWISLQSKGLSRVFSNTTVLKHNYTQVGLFLSSVFCSIDVFAFSFTNITLLWLL